MPTKLFGFAGDWPAGLSQDLLQRYARSVATATNQIVTSPAGGRLAFCLSAEFTASSEGIAVACEGLPAWPTDPEIAQAGNPAAQILLAYRRYGAQFLERIRGAFALAVGDASAQSVLLGIDQMGIQRLTYAHAGQGIAFSASASAVARFPAIDTGLRAQALYDYLLLHMVPAPDTVYEKVSKLRPGTFAQWQQGKLETRRYWQPRFVERGAPSFAELQSGLKSSLEAAVRRCLPDAHTGAFLSGGLDSSSVAGMFAKVHGERAPTFSMGFGVDSYDELSYARVANQHFNCEGHEYHVTADDIVTAFPSIAASYDEPFGNSSAVPTYMCAKFASEHGMTHLLAGDGGDELFAGNERYVKQRVFEAYFRIPAALRSAVIEPLTRRIDPASGIMPLRKLRSYVDQARVGLPERLESWNLVYREGPARLLAPEYLGQIDPRAPLANMRRVFDEIADASLANRMLFYDWHFTLSDNDLRKVGTMCELAGMRVSYPMLDPQVIDLSLQVPSNLKIEHNELRAFYKKAMADFLPAQIINKQKHGFGLPFGVWLKTHKALGELIFAHLDSLRRRRIVNPLFIDEIVASHRSGDASFYGYPLWDMAMLDAWMSAHGLPS